MNANNVGVPGTVTKAAALTLILTASIAFSGGLIVSGGTLTTANAVDLTGAEAVGTLFFFGAVQQACGTCSHTSSMEILLIFGSRPPYQV